MSEGLSKANHNKDKEVRRQEQNEEEKEFDRGLPGKYTAKLIHG